MKKMLSLLVLLLTVLLFSISCELNPENNLATLPSYLTQTMFINYDSTIGSAVINSQGIDVIEGSNPSHGDRIFYTRAKEFDTSTLNDAGYSITTTYTDESDETTPSGDVEATLTMVCEKDGSPTITFIFGIYYQNDIIVEKKIDDEDVSGWQTILTWTEI